MLNSIPPKYSVPQVVGCIKGKSAIHIARVYGEREHNYASQRLWARGYFHIDGGQVREYIREHELEDRRLEQLEAIA